jgi:hypothetical protein
LYCRTNVIQLINVLYHLFGNYVASREKNRNSHCFYFCTKLEGNENLQDLGVNERVILKWNLKI